MSFSLFHTAETPSEHILHLACHSDKIMRKHETFWYIAAYHFKLSSPLAVIRGKCLSRLDFLRQTIKQNKLTEERNGGRNFYDNIFIMIKMNGCDVCCLGLSRDFTCGWQFLKAMYLKIGSRSWVLIPKFFRFSMVFNFIFLKHRL